MSTTALGASPAGAGPTPGTAQATLLNILGDVVHPSRTPVPTAAFLEVMGALDFSEPASRQAITRCATAGWITKERTGRSTNWSLTPAGATLVTDGIAGVEQLSDPHAEWDGRWQIIVITISNQHRSTRDRVYRSLRWDGFGNPLPSVWVSPHPGRLRRARSVITELGLDRSTLSFVGEADAIGLPVHDMVRRAWALDDLEQHYSSLVTTFQSVRVSNDAERLIALLRLDQELQQLLVTDPHLPSSLTPHWSGRDSAAELLELRRTWHSPARQRWQEITSRYGTS